MHEKTLIFCDVGVRRTRLYHYENRGHVKKRQIQAIVVVIFFDKPLIFSLFRIHGKPFLLIISDRVF